MISAGQAAKLAGVSKPTISAALKSGRLSYVEKTERGYRIDPAEVRRVFGEPVTPSTADPSSRTDLTPSEREGYEKQIALLERMVDEMKGERDHLRTLTLPDRRPWWRKLVG